MDTNWTIIARHIIQTLPDSFEKRVALLDAVIQVMPRTNTPAPADATATEEAIVNLLAHLNHHQLARREILDRTQGTNDPKTKHDGGSGHHG